MIAYCVHIYTAASLIHPPKPNPVRIRIYPLKLPVAFPWPTIRSSAIAEGLYATRLLVQILQLQNIPFENDCN